MKFSDVRQSIFEMAVGKEHGVKTYYHGTDYDTGKKIKKDGFVDAPIYDTERGFLMPRSGRAYLTSDLLFVITNAIGMNAESLKGKEYFNKPYKNRRCAIVIIDAKDVSDDFDVDEDDIAELLDKIHWKKEGDNSFEIKLAEEIFRRFVTDRLRDRWNRYGRNITFHQSVSIAKQVLKQIKPGDSIRTRLNKYAKSIAHKGAVKIKEVRWFYSNDITKVKVDLSNFWEITKPL